MWRYFVAIFLVAVSAWVQAGSACSDRAPEPESLRKGLNLALMTRDALDASGARVALVARVGQDLSKYGLRYSHVGIAWRDHPEGRWLVVHLLNECGTAESNLYDHGLGNFYTDDLFAWDTKILIPSEYAQIRLEAALESRHIEKLHQHRYNMLAYPYSIRYQNSNQWVLEALNEGYQDKTATNRREAQSWYREQGYLPTRLNLGPLTRLGGRIFQANITFDDHPDELRWNDKIDTVTVESISNFIGIIDPKSQSITLTFN